MDAKTIVAKLNQHSHKIRSFGVTSLSLFGSYAQGVQKSESDIDLLVEFSKQRGGFDDYVNLSMFLEELFDVDVDLVKPSLLHNEIRDEVLGGKRIEAKI